MAPAFLAYARRHMPLHAPPASLRTLSSVKRLVVPGALAFALLLIGCLSSSSTAALGSSVFSPHQNRCTTEQLDAVPRCYADFKANQADCALIGFNPNTAPTNAVSGDCGSCLIANTDSPGAAFKAYSAGNLSFFGVNEVGCLEAFASRACGELARRVISCLARTCVLDGEYMSPAAFAACEKSSLTGSCASESQALRPCLDDSIRVSDASTIATTLSGDADPGVPVDAGPILISAEAGTTVSPVVDICSRFQSFTGEATPSDVVFAWANYLCGP